MSNADFSVEFTFTDQELSKLKSAIEQAFDEYDLPKIVGQAAEAGTEDAIEGNKVKVDFSDIDWKQIETNILSPTEGISGMMTIGREDDFEKLINVVDNRMNINASYYNDRIKKSMGALANPSQVNVLNAKLEDLMLQMTTTDFTKRAIGRTGTENVDELFTMMTDFKERLNEIFVGKSEEVMGTKLRYLTETGIGEQDFKDIKAMFHAMSTMSLAIERGKGGTTTKFLDDLLNSLNIHDKLADMIARSVERETGYSTVREAGVRGSQERLDVMVLDERGRAVSAIEVKTGLGGISGGAKAQNLDKLMRSLEPLESFENKDDMMEYIGSLFLGFGGKRVVNPDILYEQAVRGIAGEYDITRSQAQLGMKPKEQFIKEYKSFEVEGVERIVKEKMDSLVKRADEIFGSYVGETEGGVNLMTILSQTQSLMKTLAMKAGIEIGELGVNFMPS